MPFTPFHFGPGLFLKGLAPRYVSLTAFVLSQIIIDLESGYHLVRGDWPVHRTLHTFPAAAAIGLLAAAAAHAARRWIPAAERPELAAETQARPAVLGGLLGGLSHPLLDGIMHADIRPFLPLSAENPMLDAIGVGALHLLCAASAVAGAVLLGLRAIGLARG